ARVADLLQPQDMENEIVHSSDPKVLVIEALLVNLRATTRKKLYVQEITKDVNSLLMCRNESAPLTNRAVGEQLRKLGLFTCRLDKAGRGIRLDEDLRHRVERLACNFGVSWAA